MKTIRPVAEIGQVSMEYAIIFSVILAAIFATRIIDKTRDSFKAYFAKASSSMTVVSKGTEAGVGGRESAGGGVVAAGQETPEADAKDIQQPDQGQSGENSSQAMAVAVKTAADIQDKLTSLKETYANNEEHYEKIRKLVPFGVYIMPKYEDTRDGKLQQMQIGAYEQAAAASAPILNGEQVSEE